MTDHGFGKWDFLSSIGEARERAKELSEKPGVVCAHVVRFAETDRRPKPEIGIVALCKGLKHEGSFEEMTKEVSMKSNPVSKEKLLIQFSFKDGIMIHPGKDHAFGCNKIDEEYEETEKTR